MAIEEISAERFTYHNYEANYWSRLGMDYTCGTLDIVKKVKEKLVGYCKASRLQFRPRDGVIAVLCEDEDGYFWFHLGEYGSEALLDEEAYNHLNDSRLEDITKEKFDRYVDAIKLDEYNPPEKHVSVIEFHANLTNDEVWTIIRNFDILKKRFCVMERKL